MTWHVRSHKRTQNQYPIDASIETEDVRDISELVELITKQIGRGAVDFIIVKKGDRAYGEYENG